MEWQTSIHEASRREPAWVDDQDHALNRSIVDKVRRQPHLLGIAVENLRRWRRRPEQRQDPVLRRWKMILITWDLQEILGFLLDPSEEALKLRRYSPFCGF